MDNLIKNLVIAELTKRMNRPPTPGEVANMINDPTVQVDILMKLVVNLRQRVAILENKV